MEGPCESKLLQLKLRIGRKILSRLAALKYLGCVHRYKIKSSCQWFIWILLTFFAEYLALHLDFSGFSSLHHSPLAKSLPEMFLVAFLFKSTLNWMEVVFSFPFCQPWLCSCYLTGGNLCFLPKPTLGNPAAAAHTKSLGFSVQAERHMQENFFFSWLTKTHWGTGRFPIGLIMKV